MGKKITYKAITRVENCIVEEKLDGENFSWVIDNNGEFHFFTSKDEITPSFKEYRIKFLPIIEYIKNKWSIIEYHYIKLQELFSNNMITTEYFDELNTLYDLLFTPNIYYFSEVIGNRVTKYFGNNFKETPIDKKLYIFDIKGISEKMYKREFVEKLMNIADLNVVPLTTFDHKESQINPNILREGIILRYEDIAGLFEDKGAREVIKLKLVERKNGKPQKITMEIKEIK